MKNLTYIFLAGLLFMLGCGPASDSVDNPKAAVYYWRTSLTLDSVERQFLSDHNVGKMYVRYFDITLDENQQLLVAQNDSLQESEPRPLPYDQLEGFLQAVKNENDDEHQFVALHADISVPYGKIVEVLDKGSKVGLKIVLATKPMDSNAPAQQPAAEPLQQAQPEPQASTSTNAPQQ